MCMPYYQDMDIWIIYILSCIEIITVVFSAALFLILENDNASIVLIRISFGVRF